MMYFNEEIIYDNAVLVMSLETDIRRSKDWEYGDEVLGIIVWMVVKTGERLKEFDISRKKGIGTHLVL